MNKTTKIGITVVALLVLTVIAAVHCFMAANSGVIFQPL